MPGATPAPPTRAGRKLARVSLALACIVAWLLAAWALWSSSSHPSLPALHLSAERYFSPHFLRTSAAYERFLAIDALLAKLTQLAVLGLFAWRGQRLMRESAAGRIGTGMMLGMLGLALVWIAELPFGVAAVWWERRHHISHQGYITALLGGYLGLGATFLAISLALAVTMALARAVGRGWWVAVLPFAGGLSVLVSFLSIDLVPATHAPERPRLQAEAATLARAEGVPGVRLVVQEVERRTTAPNAEAVGFGSTRGVIVWDTLLDGRFDRAEVRAVLAHELGHLAHQDPLKAVGWLVLLLAPATWLIAMLTRGRGGMAQPEAVPLGLLILVLVNVLALPLHNAVSRRIEADADWASLQTTHDPATTRALFQKLARTSEANPDPPTWSYLLDADHPTIMQRLQMAEAFARLHDAKPSL